jgi:hypothetical protein
MASERREEGLNEGEKERPYCNLEKEGPQDDDDDKGRCLAFFVACLISVRPLRAAE